MTRAQRIALAALVRLAAGCSTTGEPPAVRSQGSATPVTNTAPGDAPVAIDAGAIGYVAAMRASEWARWPGLPADLREADVVRDLGLDLATTTRHAGRLGRLDAVIVEAPWLRYWLRDRDRVVLIELTGRLGTASPGTLRSALGQADREGAGRFLVSGATTTEYVYAGRGLALTIAESYDHPPSFAPRLAAIQLFAASDLRTFVLELGGNDRVGPSR
jgi:hypothetical protein